MPHARDPDRLLVHPSHVRVDRGEATDPAAADRIRAAKAACRRCPVAESCLRWALAHPDATRTNVWAATPAGERRLLRARLARRLGPNWTAALARPTS